MKDDELLTLDDIGLILRSSSNRVSHLARSDPFFPALAETRINKRTGRKMRLWRKSDIVQYKQHRIFTHPGYRSALRRAGEAVSPSELPVAILSIDELRSECERLRKLVADLSEYDE